MARRRVIGVFLAGLSDAYQGVVWRGIERRARERGLGVVAFIGSRVDSPVRPEKRANLAYGLAGPRSIDGLVTVSSVIATFLEPRGIDRLFASRGSLPQVSIGYRVPGFSSVTVDGTGSVAALIRHIAGYHRRRRFALVGGPAGHAEAQDRERAFRDTLADLGVTFDERLAARGSFLRGSGADAMRSLLRKNLPFNAVFCTNDAMALGVVDVLRESGLSVPRDVAVAGFDGIEEGRYLTPPLTTVIQPLGELGSRAVDLLVDRMNGGGPVEQVLTGTPVIRQSCGCTPRMGQESDLVSLRSRALPAERRAIDRLGALARAGDADGFVAVLDAALAGAATDTDLLQWMDYLSAARRRAFPRGRVSPEAAAVFEFASALVGETASRRQAARRVAGERQAAAVREIGAYVGGAFDLPLVLRRLQEALTDLGIQSGYVTLFDGETGVPAVGLPEPGRPEADGPELSARLVFAARPGRGRPAVKRPARRFPAERLLPASEGEAWRGGTWILEPLVYQDEALGYLLVSGGAADPAVYDTLREQLSSALKGALLMEQVLGHEHRLEEEVKRRTTELTRANRELTREVARRRTLEREVLEVSNRTMQRIGQDLHDDLSQHLAGIAMLVSVLRSAAAAGDPSASGAAAAAKLDQIGGLLSESIARAKQIARGLYPAGLAEHGLPAAVGELVTAARQSYPAQVDFRAQPGFSIPDTDRAVQVYRIVQEALTNALKHSRAQRVEVILSREEGEEGPELVAEVTDNGSGIAGPSVSARGNGMGLRIMRYRAESAGARLLIEDLAPGTRVRCAIPGVEADR
ncbi:MAG TPA: substrate-binding domain-containing protein [Spirochaetia bacterium]|nr:substrate-binding domain-containing protein [Spirochaetia bacterium]